MRKLNSKSVTLIEDAVDRLFQRAKARFLGRVPPGTPKGLILSLRPDLSIGAVFKDAARSEGVAHNQDLQASIVAIGESYLDAIQAKTKAKTVQKVHAFLANANKDTDLETVLGGELADLWAEVNSDMKRVIETETTVARNTSTLDAITKVNLSAGIADPYVYFVPVKDKDLCVECRRLHLLKDGVTPRVWKMSQVGSGYHKKGEPNPKVGGLHPHCRCVLCTLMPGFGFNPDGSVAYVSPGWNQYENQPS